MHGKGAFIWSNKKKYIGEFKQDRKDGFGKYIWPDGREYKGNWKDGKQHGYAKYKISSEDKNGVEQVNIRYGLWEDGKLTKWFIVNQEDKQRLSLNKLTSDNEGTTEESDVSVLHLSSLGSFQ